jgi:hypothetical protein
MPTPREIEGCTLIEVPVVNSRARILVSRALDKYCFYILPAADPRRFLFAIDATAAKSLAAALNPPPPDPSLGPALGTVIRRGPRLVGGLVERSRAR